MGARSSEERKIRQESVVLCGSVGASAETRSMPKAQQYVTAKEVLVGAGEA